MLRFATLSSLAVVLAGCGGDGTGVTTIGAGLTGPRGLQATVFARGIPHVSALSFDAGGGLWATGSGANTHSSDGVYVVAKEGARATRVVRGPRGPLGLIWIGKGLYVSSLGAVTRFSGYANGRFTTKSTVLDGPVAGGENNNLVRSPSGALLMGISSTCDHCTPASRYAATIVSFRPDGTGLAVYAHGIRAAFGLAFVPGTSFLLASMNQRDDLGANTPGDSLGYVRRGSNWGFPRCYGQGGAACQGAPTPLAVLDKHAAAGGVAVLTGQFGGRYKGSALVAEWQTGRVLRVPLHTSNTGVTGGAAQAFVTGIHNPLPIATAPDGAVLIGDWSTGVVYRIAAS